MAYKIGKKDKKIKILGEKFVLRNKYKCHLIIRNKKAPLKKEISTKEIDNNEIKLKIIGLNTISDLTNLFHGCRNLLYFQKSIDHRIYYSPFIGREEEQEIIKNDLYYNYNYTSNENSENSKLKTDSQSSQSEQLYSTEILNLTITNSNEDKSFLFSNINEAKVHLDNNLKKFCKKDAIIVNMSNMFFQCLSLKSIPDDISEINTDNVIDINNMFYGCSNLTSLPDISKWKTDKVENMKGLFQKCSSLLSLPDISIWNINNAIDISYLFCGCRTLINLPNINK